MLFYLKENLLDFSWFKIEYEKVNVFDGGIKNQLFGLFSKCFRSIFVKNILKDGCYLPYFQKTQTDKTY